MLGKNISRRVTSRREVIFVPLPRENSTFSKFKFTFLSICGYNDKKKYLTILNLLYQGIWQSWGKIIVFILFPLDQQERLHQKNPSFEDRKLDERASLNKASRGSIACLISLVSIVAIASARVPSNSCSIHRNELCIPRPRFWISCLGRGGREQRWNSITPYSRSLSIPGIQSLPGLKVQIPKDPNRKFELPFDQRLIIRP